VEDVASANLLALTKKNAAGEIFNIASGKATTINELFQILQEKMGKKGFKPVHIKSRAGDIRHSYANIEKAKTRLGYDPVFSLENGLKELVRHMVDS
jgi:nucleoside-diphosphate-sugar epimerase